MAEKIRTHTEYQAQRLNQLLRADANYNIGRNRFNKDRQVPQSITVTPKSDDVEPFTFVLDKYQVDTFFRIRKALIEDLAREGIGDIAMQILANRPQRMMEKPRD